MIAWVLMNIKKTIAILTFLITIVAMPLWLSTFGFIVQTKVANAEVQKHAERLTALESAVYKIDGRLEEILNSNRRIEQAGQEAIDRAKSITKEVRQLRQND